MTFTPGGGFGRYDPVEWDYKLGEMLDISELMEKKDSKNELEQALKRLPEREKMLLVLYYQQNMTLKEIGEIINVSESRVCQLHSQAIMKLRNILSAKRTERLSKSIV